MNKKLLQLAEESTQRVESDRYKFYWQSQGYKFDNKNLSKWFEKETGHWSTFSCSQLEDIKQNLADKKLDMQHDYSTDFVKKLREKYGYIQLFFSGGYDSTTILKKFVDNGLRIDETCTLTIGNFDDECNQEVHFLATPAIVKYQEHIDKTTIINNSYEMLADWFEDPYRFFTMPGDSNLPYGFGRLGNATSLRNSRPDGCYIKGHDKPQLIYYRDKWYAVNLDNAINGDTDVPNMYWFWLEGDNIKSYLQDARKYRDHLVNSRNIEKKLQFFKPSQSEEDNVNVLHRAAICNPDKILRKDLSGKVLLRKHKQRLISMIENNQNRLLTNYFTCQAKYNEILGDDNRDLGRSNDNSKFSWMIDIDSLEVFTQQELIPNGFDDTGWL